MDREEEIKQAIKDICGCKSCKFDRDYCNCCKERNVAIEAINWADHYPKKGLWDGEKVIGWLKDNADLHTWYNEFEGESGMTDDFIEDLTKAMEE